MRVLLVVAVCAVLATAGVALAQSASDDSLLEVEAGRSESPWKVAETMSAKPRKLPVENLGYRDRARTHKLRNKLAGKIFLAHRHLRAKYLAWQKRVVRRAHKLALKIKVAERKLRRELVRQRRAAQSTTKVVQTVSTRIPRLQARLTSAQKALQHVLQLQQRNAQSYQKQRERVKARIAALSARIAAAKQAAQAAATAKAAALAAAAKTPATPAAKAPATPAPKTPAAAPKAPAPANSLQPTGAPQQQQRSGIFARGAMAGVGRRFRFAEAPVDELSTEEIEKGLFTDADFDAEDSDAVELQEVEKASADLENDLPESENAAEVDANADDDQDSDEEHDVDEQDSEDSENSDDLDAQMSELSELLDKDDDDTPKARHHHHSKRFRQAPAAKTAPVPSATAPAPAAPAPTAAAPAPAAPAPIAPKLPAPIKLAAAAAPAVPAPVVTAAAPAPAATTAAPAANASAAPAVPALTPLPTAATIASAVAQATGLCASGTRQSPIQLRRATVNYTTHANDRAGQDKIISLQYRAMSNLTMTNTGSLLKVTGLQSQCGLSCLGFITSGCCNRDKYYVRELQFFSPSQHAMEVTSDSLPGGRYPLELQIVHQKEGSTGDNNLIVVSLFFIEKKTPGANKFLQSLDWQAAPRNANGVNRIAGVVDLKDLEYSLDSDYFSYTGSLTSGACTENVEYRVMTQPQGMTQWQYNVIRSMFTSGTPASVGNARPLQERNGREVSFFKRHVYTAQPDSTRASNRYQWVKTCTTTVTQC